MRRVLQTTNIPRLISSLVVGLVFVSEGLQKFLYPGSAGTERFSKIGFTDPAFWVYFTACFEVAGDLLIFLAGLLTRLAAIPLLKIMITALVTIKGLSLLTRLSGKGTRIPDRFYHDHASDLLLLYGGGNKSLDLKFYSSSKNKL